MSCDDFKNRAMYVLDMTSDDPACGGTYQIAFPEGFDPRCDVLSPFTTIGYPAPLGTIGSVCLGDKGRVFVKRGSGDADWDELEQSLAQIEITRIVGNALILPAALPGAGQKLVSTGDPEGFLIPDNRAAVIRVSAVASQLDSPSGVTSEGSNGNLFSMQETFLVANDGVNLNIYAAVANPHELQTDYKIWVDANGNPLNSNDGDMGFEYIAIDKNTLQVNAFNGTDNGGGDSGRTMQWGGAITMLDELEIPFICE